MPEDIYLSRSSADEFIAKLALYLGVKALIFQSLSTMIPRFLQKLTIGLIAATIPMLPLPQLVFAQTTRISDLQSPRAITIAGRVQSIIGNKFILNDGTGDIIVDAGPRWWQDINLSMGEQVTVTGELSKKGDEFNAFSITRATGSVIEIRSPQGPPPWAGGRNRVPRPKK
ncbi:DNA-binding protein [Nodularia chucula]|uniref:DNA-binding protein n=1 Tax=Nodularia chucula TaxID=3093667 RepID=UPI0039C6D5A3